MRKKDQDLFKASFKSKKAIVAKDAATGQAVEDEEDSDWESVEEDFPGVKLSELLDGLTLEVNNEPGMDDDDDDDEDEQPV